jgi:hypothetical protein
MIMSTFYNTPYPIYPDRNLKMKTCGNNRPYPQVTPSFTLSRKPEKPFPFYTALTVLGSVTSIVTAVSAGLKHLLKL